MWDSYQKRYLFLLQLILLQFLFFIPFGEATVQRGPLTYCEILLLEGPALNDDSVAGILRRRIEVATTLIRSRDVNISIFGTNLGEMITGIKAAIFETKDNINPESKAKKALAQWMLALIPEILTIERSTSVDEQWMRDLLPVMLAYSISKLKTGTSLEQKELAAIFARIVINRNHNISARVKTEFWDAFYIAFFGKHATTSMQLVGRSISDCIQCDSLQAMNSGIANKIIFDNPEFRESWDGYYSGVESIFFPAVPEYLIVYAPMYNGASTIEKEGKAYLAGLTNGIFGEVYIIFKKPMSLREFLSSTGIKIDAGQDLDSERTTVSMPLTYMEMLNLSKLPFIMKIRVMAMSGFIYSSKQ